MPIIATIGLQRRPLADFVTTLQRAGIDVVIDVRLHNTSQLAGYSKRDDLAFLLQEGFGIAYEHHPELAPTDEIRQAYLKETDWEGYVRAFLPLMAERASETVGRDITSRYRAPCLLCAERTPDRCHRRLVAEYWAEHLTGLEVMHL